MTHHAETATPDTDTAPPPKKKLDKSQLLKWTVYALLVVNWGYYFIEEMYVASHILGDGGSFLEWTVELATTIDNFAWFGLLFMFELETYMLEDKTLEKRSVRWSLHGFRVLCYVFLLHTVYARIDSYVHTKAITEPLAITSLCEVADQDLSFGKNVRYTTISSENCNSLSAESTFYVLEPAMVPDSAGIVPEPTVVTDRSGLELEMKHVFVDLVDALTWILVIWAIELAVWLQNRNITGGRLMLVSQAAKVFYLVLFADAAFWLSVGHWVYAWDQMLWILGFWAIENNLSEWRGEIREAIGKKLQWANPGEPDP